MSKIKILASFILSKLLVGLSCLFPRNKKIWIFGSFNGCFNDNSKYLFLYVYENCKDITPIWISKNKALVDSLKSKNFKAYYKWSFKGVFFCLRGKFYFYNAYISDISEYLYGNAIKFNLWHGTPIKKIEFDILVGQIGKIFNKSIKSRIAYKNNYIRPDYILSTSSLVSECYSSAFRIDVDRCLEVGYPRNVLLTYSPSHVFKFISNYESKHILSLVKNLKKYNRVYIYMPTWRDDNSDFIKQSDIDFGALNILLNNESSFLILKLHSNTKLDINLNYENILLLETSDDVYPILPFTDVLITDYSSIIFDYKLMNKKVVLFPFDQRAYLNKNREMYYDYNIFIRSEIVAYTFDTLLDVMKHIDKYCYKHNDIINKVVNIENVTSSNSNIVSFVKEL